MFAASRWPMVVSGDDSSTTGSSDQADMVQSDVSGNCAISASATGTRSGAQNDTAASRRSAYSGHRMSRRRRVVGRIAAIARITGSAT